MKNIWMQYNDLINDDEFMNLVGEYYTWERFLSDAGKVVAEMMIARGEMLEMQYNKANSRMVNIIGDMNELRRASERDPESKQIYEILDAGWTWGKACLSEMKRRDEPISGIVERANDGIPPTEEEIRRHFRADDKMINYLRDVADVCGEHVETHIARMRRIPNCDAIDKITGIEIKSRVHELHTRYLLEGFGWKVVLQSEQLRTDGVKTPDFVVENTSIGLINVECRNFESSEFKSKDFRYFDESKMGYGYTPRDLRINERLSEKAERYPELPLLLVIGTCDHQSQVTDGLFGLVDYISIDAESGESVGSGTQFDPESVLLSDKYPHVIAVLELNYNRGGYLGRPECRLFEGRNKNSAVPLELTAIVRGASHGQSTECGYSIDRSDDKDEE